MFQQSIFYPPNQAIHINSLLLVSSLVFCLFYLVDNIVGTINSRKDSTLATIFVLLEIQKAMFGKLAEAQKKAEEVKQRLAAITVEGTTGTVKVIADGNRKIKDIQIPDELIQLNRKEELQDLILAAVENAMNQADNVSQSEMQSLMSSMMPGIGGLFGKK